MVEQETKRVKKYSIWGWKWVDVPVLRNKNDKIIFNSPTSRSIETDGSHCHICDRPIPLDQRGIKWRGEYSIHAKCIEGYKEII